MAVEKKQGCAGCLAVLAVVTVIALVLDRSPNKPGKETTPATPVRSSPAQPSPTPRPIPIADSVAKDESENHRVRVDPQDGKVVAVRSTAGAVLPLDTVCRLACNEEWSDATVIYSDETAEYYIPNKDLDNLVSWRMHTDWKHAGPFATTFYIRSRADMSYLQEKCIIHSAAASGTVLSTQNVAPDGELAGAPDVSQIPLDFIALAGEEPSRPIYLAISALVRRLAFQQSMINDALGVH